MSIGAFNIDLTDFYHVAKYLENKGCAYQYFDDATFNGHTVTVRGKKYVHFASCSYLGLETHPALIEACVEAVRKYGTQTPSSRAMLSSPLYREFEDHLTQVFPGHSVVTQTVTLAHCSVLPLLIGEKDAIIMDAYAHNSLRMASQLCTAKGTFSLLALHNNMENVEYFVRRLQKEGYRNIWYCADGIYSIHGNYCDVKNLHRLLDTYDNFYAYVDDAHGTGWCGKNGSGYVIGEFGLHPKMIVAESFAKSMVCSGGCVVVPDPTLAEYIRFAGQTMIFSGPIQPAVLGSMVACIKLHLSDEIIGYQQELLSLIRYFRKRTEELGLPIVTQDETPIQLLRIGDIDKTFSALDKLMENGFFPFTAVYPAISKGNEGIRITITRHLTIEDINRFLECLKSLSNVV
jgi:7-keto-8-aminopelargonate synthetase-like enzyme